MRRRPLSRDESFAARQELQDAAMQGRLPWDQGVRAIRRALGLTQREFAKHFDLTVRQLSELERGVANPRVDTLLRLARPLGFTIGFIPIAKPAK